MEYELTVGQLMLIVTAFVGFGALIGAVAMGANPLVPVVAWWLGVVA